MLEDAIGAAAKSLTSTTLGAVLFLALVGWYFTARALRQDIREVQDELKRERDAHQKTREEQITDLRNLGNVAIAVDRMRDALIDNSLGRSR